MDQPDEDRHPWEAPSGRFPTDDHLRFWGWELLDRPEIGEPVWRHRRLGIVMLQSEACLSIYQFLGEAAPMGFAA